MPRRVSAGFRPDRPARRRLAAMSDRAQRMGLRPGHRHRGRARCSTPGTRAPRWAPAEPDADAVRRAGRRWSPRPRTDPRRGVPHAGGARGRSTSTPPPADAADAYLRLHLLSHRLVAARTASTSTASSACSPTWCGPTPARAPSRASSAPGCGCAPSGPVQVFGVDKFPRMVDYVRAVRRADRRRRPGAARRPPGRGHHRDARGLRQLQRRHARHLDGRGPDRRGRRRRRRLRHRRRRLDHGHAVRRRHRAWSRIGERCLLGANAGIGISLGDDCVVEAGLLRHRPAPRSRCADGRVVKAAELSGRVGLLFLPQLGDRAASRRAAHRPGHRAQHRPARQRLTPLLARCGPPAVGGGAASRGRALLAVAARRRGWSAATSGVKGVVTNFGATDLPGDRAGHERDLHPRADRPTPPRSAPSRCAGACRPRAATIAIATAIQESKLRNITCGDRDSLGLFQQRPRQGWGTADAGHRPGLRQRRVLRRPGQGRGLRDLPITKVAQEVQRSAFPEAYADHEQEGRVLASALTGYSPGGLGCRLADADRGAAARPRSSRSSRPSSGMTGHDSGRDGDAAESRPRAPGRPAHGPWPTPSTTAPLTVTVGDRTWSRSRDESAWSWQRARTPVAATLRRGPPGVSAPARRTLSDRRGSDAESGPTSRRRWAAPPCGGVRSAVQPRLSGRRGRRSRARSAPV